MNAQFKTIYFQPNMVQFVADNLVWIVGLAVSILYVGAENTRYHPFAATLTVFLGLYLLLAFVLLSKKRYILTSETLVYERGIFSRKTDYIELYRVIDFQERHSFLQRLFGIKTIIIYSGDRTTPQLYVPGVHHKEDLISAIRERVEYNKTRRGVYEITNRN